MRVKNIHFHKPVVKTNKVTKVTKVSQKAVLDEVVGLSNPLKLPTVKVKKYKKRGGLKTPP